MEICNGATTPASFKSLVGHVSLQFLQACDAVLVYYLPGKGNSNGFHLAYPTIIALTLQVKEPM